MVSGQVLESMVKGVRDVTSYDMCISDGTGATIAGTFMPDVDFLNKIVSFIDSGNRVFHESGICLVKDKYLGNKNTFVISLKYKDACTEAHAEKISRMAALQLKQLFEAYDSKTLVNDFIEKLLRGEGTHGTVESEAADLGIDPAVRCGIIIAEAVAGKATDVYEEMKSVFLDQDNTHIISIDRDFVAVVTSADSEKELGEKADRLYDTLNDKEKRVQRMGIGLIANGIMELRSAYLQACMAVNVSRMFYEERKVASYMKLGLGRLIYSLDAEICRAFLKEHFEKSTIDSIDEESINTVNAFFENSLNISETSRQLFIHRNTLIYRLNKLQKITGLDVRKLDDAIIFKVSIMAYKKYKTEP